MKPPARRWWHRPLAFVLRWLLAAYMKTWRVTFVGKEEVEEYLRTSPLGAVFLIWHDSLFMVPLLQFAVRLQPMHILISNSRDGDIASELAMQYPNTHVLRVRHLARAHALAESCRLLQSRKSLIITPDGPRGPRHEMKPGAAYAAEKTGAKAFFITCVPSRFVSLRSWDRFMIPLPFSRVTLKFEELPSFPLK